MRRVPWILGGRVFLLWCLGLAVVVSLLPESSASMGDSGTLAQFGVIGYVNPGVGQLVFQMLLGALFGSMFFLVRLFRRIFRPGKGSTTPGSPDEA